MKVSLKSRSKILIGLSLAMALVFTAAGEASAFWPFDQHRSNGKGARSQKMGVSESSITESLTLSRAYALALKRSEDIAIKEEIIEEAQGHFYQALDVIMPKVHFVMTRTDQDAPEQDTGSSSSSNSSRSSTPQKKFTFSQPLFSGFKEFAALQASGAEKSQRRFEKERAEQLLFIDVMEAFYAYLSAREDQEILLKTKNAIEGRTKELNIRVENGRSRRSESSVSESELKVAEADLIEAERTEKISKELLEFYIGKSIDGEVVPDPPAPTDIQEVSYYLEKVNLRADVRATEEAEVLAGKNVVVAQSGLFPKITLDGNYYTQRVGFQSGNDWDTLLTIDVPIFEGTQVIGDIKVAHAEREQAEQTTSKTKRLAELEIRQAYDNFIYSSRRAGALSEAAAALIKNYELISEDYRHNLSSNLDALDALRRSEDEARNSNNAQFEARRDYWKLRIAAGETP